jgi:uncharacterized membrane protein YgdD (TMEM256/DUF423 family)
MANALLLTAAVSGLTAVGFGAFGAHALKARLDSDLLAIYQTGVQYHFYHTLALLAVVLLSLHAPRQALLQWSGWLFVVGILIFSGSLYLLALSGVRWLGAITPIGGVAFIGGWLLLAIAALQWGR